MAGVGQDKAASRAWLCSPETLRLFRPTFYDFRLNDKEQQYGGIQLHAVKKCTRNYYVMREAEGDVLLGRSLRLHKPTQHVCPLR